MDIVRNITDLRSVVGGWRAKSESVGLIPTMGALHDGHLALVHASTQSCNRSVASIFVNPAQFGLNEDLDSYPRREARDVELLESARCDLLFAPTADVMYPDGFATTVQVPRLADRLCGKARPHHFGGVATVVTKLLLQCLPDRAFFGEKDYQQLQIIMRMARDLDIPVKIVGVPTVRDADGLALSSRNQYLDENARGVSLALNQALRDAAERLSSGRTSPEEERRRGIMALLDAGFDKVDYFEICDAETLDPLTSVIRPARVLAAAHLGKTRLIDNMAVDPPSI